MKLDLRASAFAVLLVFAPLRVEAETLIRLDVPEDHSRLVVREMKQELGRIVEGADLELRWANASGRPGVAVGQTVSVSLLGECLGLAAEKPGVGPLGWTKTANSQVLPYVEVSCGRVTALLEPAWTRHSQLERELLLGRALGRVLAHELAHAMTRSKHHAGEGLRKPALSPRELMTGEYRMASSDFERSRPAPQLAEARDPEPVDNESSLLGGDAGR